MQAINCKQHKLSNRLTMVQILKTSESILFLLLIINVITSTNSEEPWSFIVLADWHGAESFAKRPGTASEAWSNSLGTINHIKQNYGGDLVLLPGDSNTGEWDTEEFIDKFDPSLTPQEAVLEAGKNCYGTVKNLFSEGGYKDILMAVGDHEIGGNAWKPGSSKMESLSSYRQTFTDGFNRNPNTGRFLFRNPIGGVDSQPIGTPFQTTSYAYKHKNVLFVTVDAFNTVGSGDAVFLDREKGRGGEGAISCTVTGDHLIWFESILIEARKDSEIKHIIVQAHVPIIQPVRKVACSGQFFDLAEQSLFWKTMQKYDVDIYFSGEVHANTVRLDDDPNSNLLQVVARGNSFNNFLKVVVTDHTIQITAYNEIGEKPRFNNNYEAYGLLTLYKWGTETHVESSGALKILDISSPLMKLTFEEIVPLQSRQVIGMVHNDFKEKLVATSILVWGINCTNSLPNEGSFGQLYDAQVANVELVPGKVDSYAVSLTELSRIAFYGTGPHSGGNILSFALWIKTSQASTEMVLAHYGSIFTGSKNSKDIFTLTLQNGTPILYTSSKKKLIPLKKNPKLNDGKWHHIAISMPNKSCLLSEVIIYVDGQALVASTFKDERIFHITSGRLSLAGFGYSSPQYENIFPNFSPFVGLIDDFKLWSRTLELSDLPTISKEKTFDLYKRKTCLRDGTETEKGISARKCKIKCLRKSDCLGYETSRTNGEPKCYLFQKKPTVGVSKKKAKCAVVV